MKEYSLNIFIIIYILIIYCISMSLDFYLVNLQLCNSLIYYHICQSFDEKQYSCIVYCDISKSFDRVWQYYINRAVVALLLA